MNDITVADKDANGNEILPSLDSILLDKDVVTVVKKRYKQVIENGGCKVFLGSPKFHIYFSKDRSPDDVRNLFY